MYCGEVKGKNGPLLFNFYPHPGQVKMCGKGPIYKVTVTEDSRETEEGFWGWWDLDGRTERFSIVYPAKMLVEICFTYGVKIEEKSGKGLLLPVTVSIIEKVA